MRIILNRIDQPMKIIGLERLTFYYILLFYLSGAFAVDLDIS